MISILLLYLTIEHKCSSIPIFIKTYARLTNVDVLLSFPQIQSWLHQLFSNDAGKNLSLSLSHQKMIFSSSLQHTYNYKYIQSTRFGYRIFLLNIKALLSRNCRYRLNYYYQTQVFYLLDFSPLHQLIDADKQQRPQQS